MKDEKGEQGRREKRKESGKKRKKRNGDEDRVIFLNYRQTSATTDNDKYIDRGKSGQDYLKSLLGPFFHQRNKTTQTTMGEEWKGVINAIDAELKSLNKKMALVRFDFDPTGACRHFANYSVARKESKKWLKYYETGVAPVLDCTLPDRDLVFLSWEGVELNLTSCRVGMTGPEDRCRHVASWLLKRLVEQGVNMASNSFRDLVVRC